MESLNCLVAVMGDSGLDAAGEADLLEAIV